MPTASLLRTCLGLLSLVSVDARRITDSPITAFASSHQFARARAQKNVAPLEMSASGHELDFAPITFATPPEPLLLEEFTDAGTVSDLAETYGTDAAADMQRLPLYQLALAGSITTFFADVMLHPMDCIKTVQQSDSGVGLSLLLAAQYLWKTAGVTGFYHGFLTYGISDALGGALKFSVWELWRKTTAEWKPAYLFLWIGAALAFLPSSILGVPGELVKQQLQMSYYDGPFEAIQGIYSQSGLPGFFVGYEAVCYRDIPYTVLELGLYEFFKNLIDNNRPAEQKPAAWEDILAAFATGAIVAVVTTPLDTVKTKLVLDDYSGFYECFSHTVHDHGWTAVFAGVDARIAWIIPFTGLYLPTYDFLKRKLLEHHIQSLQAQPEKQ
jgi:solute carrier family 25 S-adenosylmethionine transporter 26